MKKSSFVKKLTLGLAVFSLAFFGAIRGNVSTTHATIRDAVLAANDTERAALKSREIAKFDHRGTFDTPAVRVEIQSVEEVDGHIEAFIRAWDAEGNRIGFGKDGTVEIERIRIFNPPILVDDPTGNIIRESVGKDGKRVQRKLKESPVEAIRSVLVDTAKRVGKSGSSIVEGKVGNTTSVFFPSLDGDVTRNNNGAPYQTWAALRAGAGTANDYTSATAECVNYGHGTAGDVWFYLTRCFFLFDTAALSGESVLSATFSFAVSVKSNAPVVPEAAISPNLVSSTPASDSALANTDYSQLGSTSFGSIAYASVVADSTTYNDITLDANGIANISTSGISKFGIKGGADFSDTDPGSTGGGEGAQSVVRFIASETSGTSADPKLTVEHEAGGGGSDPILKTWGGGVSAGGVMGW